MGTVRAELAFPLENRGWAAAAVARGVEEAALALGIGGLLDRSTHELSRRRAAARRARRRARRAARGCCCSTSRPRSSTRSRATSCSACCGALNEEWGTAVAARRAPARALPARRRPRDRARATAGSPATSTPARLRLAPDARADPGRAAVRAGRPAPAPGHGQGGAPRAARSGPATRRHAATTRAARRQRAAPRGVRAAPRRAAPRRSRSSDVWLELRDGPAVLRGVDAARRRRASGRADGPQRRGQVDAAAGRPPACSDADARHGAATRPRRAAAAAPGRLPLHERVDDELPRRAGRAPGSASSPPATRATSPAASASGSRSSSCSARERPRCVLLDEPTRGMDRAPQGRARRAGCARSPPPAPRSIVATHDAEFAAAFATRVVLLGDGRPVADAPTAEVLARRLVLRDPDRARARRRGRRADARAGRARSLAAARRRRCDDELDRRPRSLLLGAVLVVGFAWYERTHPTTRVLALVATLAALAALGRVAFAAAAERQADDRHRADRRATCSAARPASWSARSPRSPRTCSSARGRGRRGRWSAGAASGCSARCWRRARRPRARAGPARARLRRRRARLRRGDEPAACGSPTRATTRSAKLVRLLRDLAAVRPRARDRQRRLLPRLRARRWCARCARFRTRFEVTWLPGAAATVGGERPCSPRCSRPPPAGRGPRRRERRRGGREGLAALPRRGAQNADGGFGGAPGPGARRSCTRGWTALGLAAAGRNPRDVAARDRDRLHRAARAGELNDLGELARTILVLAAAGRSPRDVGGRDLVAELLRKRQARRELRRAREHDRVRGAGAAGRGPLAVLARRCAAPGAGSPARRTATAASTSPAGAARRGSTTPARRSRALAAAGPQAHQDGRAARPRFLVRRQNADGGFPLAPGGASNAQSTAWAVQGLARRGARPREASRGARATRSPTCARSTSASRRGPLLAHQPRRRPVWVTAQAVTALARKPLPLQPVARARRRRPRRRRHERPPTPAPAAAPAPEAATPRARPAPRPRGPRGRRRERGARRSAVAARRRAGRPRTGPASSPGWPRTP